MSINVNEIFLFLEFVKSFIHIKQIEKIRHRISPRLPDI